MPAAVQLARGLGADVVLPLTDGWLQAVKDHTDGRGVDLVVDPIGGEAFDDAIRALDTEGRLLVIGFAAGLLSFIPYLGSLSGIIISLCVAIAQFWPDWKRITLVVAIFLVGQFIEGNIVSPKFVGERVGLHPVWLIFAMFAFGYLFGFVGLLIAVPLGAAIAVLLRFGLRQYFASPLYAGDKPS